MRGGVTHKVSLYADDLLWYISTSSIPIIMSILEQFGKFSGYKLNFQKSKLFPINPMATRMPHSLFPFKRMDTGFKYLGIVITKSFPHNFKEIFLPLLERCKEDFKRWSTLPLSLAGLINLIKMTVLPTFLYPFSMGGMALPNFLNYYWACNTQKLLYWYNLENTPLWVQMEMCYSQQSPYSLVCSSLPLVSVISSMPTVNHTLKIWTQFRRHFGLNRPSSHTPICLNHLFKPSCTDLTF